jgi:hypothetical protein
MHPGRIFPATSTEAPSGGAGDQAMDAMDRTTRSGPEATPTARCLIEGCPCRDARIVSHRRARFFAHLATRRGETADRVVAPDPSWRLPTP